jgi:hypothetical protein
VRSLISEWPIAVAMPRMAAPAAKAMVIAIGRPPDVPASRARPPPWY